MYPIVTQIPGWVPFLGGEDITSFGVMMLFAFLTAGYLARADMRRIGEDPEKVWDLLFMAVVGGIVGAKAYYVLLNYPRLLDDPLGTIFARGGLVWYGGFTLATVLVVWEIKRRELPLPTMADVIAPTLAAAYAVGRLGCFLVGDDWGRPTDSWVGIAFPQGAPSTTVANIEALGIAVDPALIEKYGTLIPVHPTQLYEVGMSTAIFFFLWRIRDHRHAAGWLFMLWFVFAGLERFLVEFLRAKDDRFFGIFTLAQIISVVMMAVGVAGMLKLGRPSTGNAERAA